MYFSNIYWNPSNIRNGHISTACSNGSNNSALVFGEGINYPPYVNFITSHSAVTNAITIINVTNNMPVTLLPTNKPVSSSPLTESTAVKPNYIFNITTTDNILVTTNSINEAVIHLETQVMVSYRTNLIVLHV